MFCGFLLSKRLYRLLSEGVLSRREASGSDKPAVNETRPFSCTYLHCRNSYFVVLPFNSLEKNKGALFAQKANQLCHNG